MGNQSQITEPGALRRNASVAPARYWLQQHVHLCVAQGHVVVLDLQRNKYLAVASPAQLTPWIEGWPALSCSSGESSSADVSTAVPPPAAAPRLLVQLLNAGLLTDDPLRGKSASLATIPRPSSSLVQFQFGVRPQMKRSDAFPIGKAWFKARLALRRLSMQRVVDRVRQRKTGAHGVADLEQARDMVLSFLWFRSLYYSPREACLLDSLALLELLAERGMYPVWVFGVKLAPFSAHCWIQEHDVTWNDTPEEVGGFTPILCI